MFDFLTQVTEPPVCKHTGCEQQAIYNLLCPSHYKSERKKIKKAKEAERKKTLLEKIFDQAVELENGCIEFSKNINLDRDKGKYRSRITVNGVRMATYRYVYERVTGDYLSEEFSIHHSCNNPLCINPKHLKKLTIAEHAQFHPIIQDPKTGRIVGKKDHSH